VNTCATCTLQTNKQTGNTHALNKKHSKKSKYTSVNKKNDYVRAEIYSMSWKRSSIA